MVFGKGGHCPDICPWGVQGNRVHRRYVCGNEHKDLALPLPSSQRPAPFASIPLGIPGFTDDTQTQSVNPDSVVHSLSLRSVSQNPRRQAKGVFPSTVACIPSLCLTLWQSPSRVWAKRKLESTFLPRTSFKSGGSERERRDTGTLGQFWKLGIQVEDLFFSQLERDVPLKVAPQPPKG